MLTWTSVVAAAPTDTDIAAAVAGRNALLIRPLIEFAPLRRAMGLPTLDDRTGEATTRSTTRSAATKQSKPRAARSSSTSKRTTPRSVAKAATARTPDAAAA